MKSYDQGGDYFSFASIVFQLHTCAKRFIGFIALRLFPRFLYKSLERKNTMRSPRHLHPPKITSELFLLKYRLEQTSALIPSQKVTISFHSWLHCDGHF